jgi:Leucine-rich repeat (LRR) protein
MQTEPPKAEPPKRKRRWFQFSLRTLMMLTLLVGLGMAIWIVPIKKRAERQQAAVEAILKVGGVVYYDYQFDPLTNFIVKSAEPPPQPAWLWRLLGRDTFANVVKADWCTDAVMQHLTEMSQLRELDFDGTQNVTDTGLKCLKGLSQLETLRLARTQITDIGLETLEEMSELRELGLSQTQITDAGVRHLKGLRQLKYLALDGTKVTDAGLIHLKPLTQLQALSLSKTIITDAGLKDLQKALPNCWINVINHLESNRPRPTAGSNQNRLPYVPAVGDNAAQPQ